MKFVAAKCPSCGANIQVDEDTKKCFCQFCGSQIFVEEAIQMIKGTVQIDFKNQIDNLFAQMNLWSKRDILTPKFISIRF